MENVISVIIPVYNVQTYLPDCLDSVTAQDYRELEIILIDDGSKDDSGAICDAYAAKDSRIRVIHQPNGGAAAAKNAGLRSATGEYLTFLDSDDTLQPGAYSHMMALMKEHDADVVQCLLQLVYRDRSEVQQVTHGRRIYPVTEYLRLFTEDWTCALMTEKLFRRSLFDGIFFEEGNVIDDEYFTYQGIMNAAVILRDDRVVYNYRQRRSSVMNVRESGSRILKNRMDYLNKRRKKVIAGFPELKRHYNEAYLESLVYLAGQPYHTPETMDMIKQAITAYFREPGWDRPGLRFLPELLRVWLGSTENLIGKAQAAAAPADPETLFP